MVMKHYTVCRMCTFIFVLYSNKFVFFSPNEFNSIIVRMKRILNGSQHLLLLLRRLLGRDETGTGTGMYSVYVWLCLLQFALSLNFFHSFFSFHSFFIPVIPFSTFAVSLFPIHLYWKFRMVCLWKRIHNDEIRIFLFSFILRHLNKSSYLYIS